VLLAAQARVAGGFSVETMVSRMVGVYDEAVSRGGIEVA